jgi:hypothetical protein
MRALTLRMKRTRAAPAPELESLANMGDLQASRSPETPDAIHWRPLYRI